MSLFQNCDIYSQAVGLCSVNAAVTIPLTNNLYPETLHSYWGVGEGCGSITEGSSENNKTSRDCDNAESSRFVFGLAGSGTVL